MIIFLAGSFAVEPNHSSFAIIYAQTSLGSHNTTQDENVYYWKWKWNGTSHIGDTKVLSGYEYELV